MRKRIYIETSVISYLCSSPSKQLIVAGNQKITKLWWENERRKYELFTSVLAIDEISAGNPVEAMKRKLAIKDLEIIQMTYEVDELAGQLIRGAKLPRSVDNDAVHIAIATVYGMSYLLTWNCAHIANPHWQRKLGEIIRRSGYDMPVICTPQALSEGE